MFLHVGGLWPHTGATRPAQGVLWTPVWGGGRLGMVYTLYMTYIYIYIYVYVYVYGVWRDGVWFLWLGSCESEC